MPYKDPQKQRENSLKNYYKNREKRLEQQKVYREENAEYFAKYKKNWEFQKVYGITIEDRDLMFIEQDGCCKICKKHEDEVSRSLHIDHCHATGRVRGLLCFKCNSLIGMAQDNVEILVNAINYLKKEN